MSITRRRFVIRSIPKQESLARRALQVGFLALGANNNTFYLLNDILCKEKRSELVASWLNLKLSVYLQTILNYFEMFSFLT